MTQRIDAARHRKPKPRSPLWWARWWLGALLRYLFVNEPAATQRPRRTVQPSPPRAVATPRPSTPTRAPRDHVPAVTEDVPRVRRPVERPGQDPADRQLAALIRQWSALRENRSPSSGPGASGRPYRGRHRGCEPAPVPWARQPANVEDDDPGPLIRPYFLYAENAA